MLGARVIRGPSWKYLSQDNGEGFVGTVVGVPSSTNDQIEVIWDYGVRMKYSLSNEESLGKLRIVDTGPAGIIHPNVKCDACKVPSIGGIRWSCMNCSDINLCTICYMGDMHQLHHCFMRKEVPDAEGVLVDPRIESTDSKIAVKGVYASAEVVRGPDWIWNNDDGGEGKLGYVLSFETWGTTKQRGAVKVVWMDDESEGLYRIGAEGYVDIIISRRTETASGGTYYKTHLPVCDKNWTCLHENKVESSQEIKLKWTVDWTCKADCEGLSVTDLNKYPTDLHLAKLALQFKWEDLHKLVIRLGLKLTEIQAFKDDYGGNLLNVAFLCLKRWKLKKNGTVGDLSKAIEDMELDIHAVCKMFRDKPMSIPEDVLKTEPTDKLIDSISWEVIIESLFLSIHLGHHASFWLRMKDDKEKIVNINKKLLQSWKSYHPKKDQMRELAQALCNIGFNITSFDI